jgi:hypothetical protein
MWHLHNLKFAFTISKLKVLSSSAVKMSKERVRARRKCSALGLTQETICSKFCLSVHRVKKLGCSILTPFRTYSHQTDCPRS